MKKIFRIVAAALSVLLALALCKGGVPMLYTLYNADQPVATFTYENGVITGYTPKQEHLLPKQICHASHEGFAGWLRLHRYRAFSC